MQTRGILTWSPPIVALALAGCGPVDPLGDIPEQASYCAITYEQSVTETREVALGFGAPSDWEAVQEGDEVARITGGQGAAMITPVVRVQGGAGDGAEVCLRVRVEEVETGNSSEYNVRFVADGDHLYSDGALYFITYSEGPLELELTVEGETFSGTASTKIVLL